MSTTVLKSKASTASVAASAIPARSPIVGPKTAPKLAPSGLLASMLPASILPYAQLMRLDRPAGLYAFYVPYLQGLAFTACVAKDVVEPAQLARDAATYLLWCVILRGYSCTWNDNMDQDFDRNVARCQNRPIARGAVSTGQAHLFTAAQLAAGVAFAAAAFASPRACMVDIAWMSALFALYPFGKRFTNYPQLILGFPFAGGIILPCHALGVDPFATNELATATVCLCLSNVFWTMIYDTIYAHQDLKDDLKAGVKSMAVRYQNSTKSLCAVLGFCQVVLLASVGKSLNFSWVYYAIVCFGTALCLFSMVTMVDLKSPASCAWFFQTDFWLVGGSISGGMLAEYAATRLAW